MTLANLEVGDTVNHPEKRGGTVTIKTPRTITIKYPKSTTKISFPKNNQEFELKDL